MSDSLNSSTPSCDFSHSVEAAIQQLQREINTAENTQDQSQCSLSDTDLAQLDAQEFDALHYINQHLHASTQQATATAASTTASIQSQQDESTQQKTIQSPHSTQQLDFIKRHEQFAAQLQCDIASLRAQISRDMQQSVRQEQVRKDSNATDIESSSSPPTPPTAPLDNYEDSAALLDGRLHHTMHCITSSHRRTQIIHTALESLVAQCESSHHLVASIGAQLSQLDRAKHNLHRALDAVKRVHVLHSTLSQLAYCTQQSLSTPYNQTHQVRPMFGELQQILVLLHALLNDLESGEWNDDDDEQNENAIHASVAQLLQSNVQSTAATATTASTHSKQKRYSDIPMIARMRAEMQDYIVLLQHEIKLYMHRELPRLRAAGGAQHQQSRKSARRSHQQQQSIDAESQPTLTDEEHNAAMTQSRIIQQLQQQMSLVSVLDQKFKSELMDWFVAHCFAEFDAQFTRHSTTKRRSANSNLTAASPLAAVSSMAVAHESHYASDSSVVQQLNQAANSHEIDSAPPTLTTLDQYMSSHRRLMHRYTHQCGYQLVVPFDWQLHVKLCDAFVTRMQPVLQFMLRSAQQSCDDAKRGAAATTAAATTLSTMNHSASIIASSPSQLASTIRARAQTVASRALSGLTNSVTSSIDLTHNSSSSTTERTASVFSFAQPATSRQRHTGSQSPPPPPPLSPSPNAQNNNNNSNMPPPLLLQQHSMPQMSPLSASNTSATDFVSVMIRALKQTLDYELEMTRVCAQLYREHCESMRQLQQQQQQSLNNRRQSKVSLSSNNNSPASDVIAASASSATVDTTSAVPTPPPNYARALACVFTPFLGAYIEKERHDIAQLVQQIDESCDWRLLNQNNNNNNESTTGASPSSSSGITPAAAASSVANARQHLSGCDDLLVYIKKSLSRCSVLARDSVMLNLFEEYKRGLELYHHAMQRHVIVARRQSLSQQLSTQQLRLLALIIHTCTYCLDVLPQFAQSVVSTIEVKYRPAIDIASVESQYGTLMSECLDVIACWIQLRCAQVLSEEMTSPVALSHWHALLNCSNESDYVWSLMSVSKSSLTQVAQHLHSSYFLNLSYKIVALVCRTYTASIFKLQHCSDTAVQQLSLDMSSLKSILLQIPNILHHSQTLQLQQQPPLDASTRVSTASQQQHNKKSSVDTAMMRKSGASALSQSAQLPSGLTQTKLKSYTRHVQSCTFVVESLLHCLSVPLHQVCVTHSALLAGTPTPPSELSSATGRNIDVLQILALRGLNRQEAQQLVAQHKQQAATHNQQAKAVPPPPH